MKRAITSVSELGEELSIVIWSDPSYTDLNRFEPVIPSIGSLDGRFSLCYWDPGRGGDRYFNSTTCELQRNVSRCKLHHVELSGYC